MVAWNKSENIDACPLCYRVGSSEEDIAPLSSIIKISSRFKPSAMTHICVWTLYLLHPTLSIKSQLEGLVQHFQGQGHQQDGCQQDGQYQLVHEDDDVDDSP